jgi:hypothetical protein
MPLHRGAQLALGRLASLNHHVLELVQDHRRHLLLLRRHRVDAVEHFGW